MIWYDDMGGEMFRSENGWQKQGNSYSLYHGAWNGRTEI